MFGLLLVSIILTLHHRLFNPNKNTNSHWKRTVVETYKSSIQTSSLHLTGLSGLVARKLRSLGALCSLHEKSAINRRPLTGHPIYHYPKSVGIGGK